MQTLTKTGGNIIITATAGREVDGGQELQLKYDLYFFYYDLYLSLLNKHALMFIARKSDHIQEDIKRNWSSWNFGQDGFKGTREDLDEYLATATEEETVCISGFEMTTLDLKRTEFGELSENYWVVIDQRFMNSIAGTELKAETIEEAIQEISNWVDYTGDGIAFDARKAKLVYSDDDIHIFEI